MFCVINQDIHGYALFNLWYFNLSKVDNGRTQGYDRPFELGPLLGGLRPDLHRYWSPQEGPMIWKPILCSSAPLRSSNCQPQGPWIEPPPSCTSRPLLLLPCTSPLANLVCLAGCHSFLFPARQRYSHNTSTSQLKVAASQGQRVSVWDRRCSRCGWP